MRVPRSSLMALAALLCGTLAPAASLRAETVSLDQPSADVPAAPAASPPGQAAPSAPATTALPDYKPEAPAAEPSPAPAATAPVAPTDPLGAAVFARFADPAPFCSV